jgi:signal transduction histidine kinase
LSQVIYSVHEDRQGRLWLPTEYGLVLFDKTTETTHVFLEQDGLTHNEFNGYSYHEGSDGRFYFGGLNGLIAFHPDSVFIDPDINSAPILLTAIQVSDDSKEANQKDITTAVQQSKVLVLQPYNKSFTVNFAYLDYGSHPNIQYAYKIEDLDKDWIYQRSNRLHFNSLPSGQYRLRIKAKGKNNVWSANEIVLPITVLKPYYLRWPFLLSAFAFICLLFYSFFRYRTYRLRLDAKILERQVIHRTKTIAQQKDDLERLYQTKGRLYAIIAHDLRDPVEAFKGFASKIKYLLKKQDMPQVIKLATFVENAAVELSKLLENLLQWAQLQQKDLPFKPEFHNIENLIKECFGNLQLIATHKNIRLEYEGTPGIEVYGDYHMLTIVFRNLIDNALKFSPTDSVIKVSASSNHQKTKITFQDFGIGMSPKQLETLFLVKKKTTSEGTLGEKGTGLGLPLCKELLDVHGAAVAVNSAPEEGTTISLSFLTKVEVGSTVM